MVRVCGWSWENGFTTYSQSKISCNNEKEWQTVIAIPINSLAGHSEFTGQEIIGTDPDIFPGSIQLEHVR